MATLYSLTVSHGSDLGTADYKALHMVRLALLAMASHGFIEAFETYSGPESTCWSFQRGSEDADQVLAQTVVLVREVCDWPVSAAVSLDGPDLA